MKRAIELTEQTDTKGIQIQIAGRINGKEIAWDEWIREGRVPLQIIRAKIDQKILFEDNPNQIQKEMKSKTIAK